MADLDDLDAQAYGYDPEGDEAVPCEELPITGTVPPCHVIPLSMLPPVGQQGTEQHMGFPPSCTAWASTYGLATAAAARAGGYAPHSPALQASPAFIYVQVIDGASDKVSTQGIDAAKSPCHGSAFAPYFAMLAAKGTPNMAEAPYVPDCTTLIADYHQPADPPNMDPAFQIGSVHCISVTAVHVMKQTLADNRPLAYSTGLYTDWKDYCGSPVPYVGNGTLSNSRHCMMIIGYDDAMGAWRIQNSAGTRWGDDGYVWMAYATFDALTGGKGKVFFYP